MAASPVRRNFYPPLVFLVTAVLVAVLLDRGDRIAGVAVLIGGFCGLLLVGLWRGRNRDAGGFPPLSPVQTSAETFRTSATVMRGIGQVSHRSLIVRQDSFDISWPEPFAEESPWLSCNGDDATVELAEQHFLGLDTAGHRRCLALTVGRGDTTTIWIAPDPGEEIGDIWRALQNAGVATVGPPPE